MNQKNWASFQAGRILSRLILLLALSPGLVRADTVPDFEANVPDPIIAQGNSVEIKQSEFDQAMGPMKFEYQARGLNLPGYFSGAVIENLMDYDLLTARANDADRLKGSLEAINEDVTNHINECGSLDQYNQSLGSLGITESDVLAIDKKADIAQAALIRLLGISVSDADARGYYRLHPAEFRYPDGSLVAFTNIEAEIKHHIEDEQVIEYRPGFMHRLKDQEQIQILNQDLLFNYHAFQMSQTGVVLQAPAIVLPPPVVKSIAFSINHFQSGGAVVDQGVLTLRADGTAHWSAVVYTARQDATQTWQVSWDIFDKAGVKLLTLPALPGPGMYNGSSPAPVKYHWDVDFKYDAGCFEKINHMTLHGSC
jgi:Family of unknown function (DUF6294)